MYVQGVDNVYDLNFNGLEGDARVTYGEVFLQAEQEYSRHNFEHANTAILLRHFEDAEAECRALLAAGAPAANANRPMHKMVLPAYDQCIKASHVFNLLDARGVISVTERQSYILRVRELAKACGEAFLLTEAGGAVTSPLRGEVAAKRRVGVLALGSNVEARSLQIARRGFRLRKEETDAEQALWDNLNRIPIEGSHFRRQVEIRSSIAQTSVSLRLKLLIEVDGRNPRH